MMNTSDLKLGSKRLTDGKLKTLCFVVESHRVAGIRVQWNPVRETEQAKGRQPLDRYACRTLKSIKLEVIIHGRYVVHSQEFHLIPGLEDITHVVEPADPRRT